MSVSGYRRLTIVLSALLVVLLVLSASLFWNYAMLKIRVEFAKEQTQFFNEMRSRAITSSPREAVECLGQIVNYYPSGSKQETGSRLDEMVEHDRSEAIHEIIVFLKAKSAEDLGDGPDAWIRKYGAK